MKHWSTFVKEDPHTKELFIEFDEALLNEVGWKVGDRIEWKANTDGSYLLTKTDGKV